MMEQRERAAFQSEIKASILGSDAAKSLISKHEITESCVTTATLHTTLSYLPPSSLKAESFSYYYPQLKKKNLVYLFTW